MLMSWKLIQINTHLNKYAIQESTTGNLPERESNPRFLTVMIIKHKAIGPPSQYVLKYILTILDLNQVFLSCTLVHCEECTLAQLHYTIEISQQSIGRQFYFKIERRHPPESFRRNLTESRIIKKKRIIYRSPIKARGNLHCIQPIRWKQST